MNRRSFLLVCTSALYATGLLAVPTRLQGAEVGRTGILRRAEYKKRRWYKRRHRRRHPFARILKDAYAGFRDSMFPVFTPLVAQLRRGVDEEQQVVWGGSGVYWDVKTQLESGSATTRDTQRWVEPVHSAVPARASSRFWRNPFVA